MEQTIRRKDGIEYKRNINDLQCDKNINIRINSETLNQFKEICNKENIKYSDLIRMLIEDYIGENKNGRKK